MPKTATYHIKIERTGKYDCVALLVDMTVEKPDSTRLVGKSIEEIMAKALVAVVLHDKNVTVDEEPKENGDVPIILTPSRKLTR